MADSSHQALIEACERGDEGPVFLARDASGHGFCRPAQVQRHIAALDDRRDQ